VNFLRAGDHRLGSPFGGRGPLLWNSCLSRRQRDRRLDACRCTALATTALATILIASASSADETQQSSIETVVVTGSRIPSVGLKSVSPVNVVDRQEIEFEGTTHIETLLNNLPSVTADQGQFQTVTANGVTTGIATVNLRDLGSKRTLVLIDGTRLMPGDPATPVADLNQIPASMVDHIEVLTGGASAVYGSDALAGAVNFILRKDFEGLEIDGTYNAAAHDNNNSVAEAAIRSAAYPVTAPPGGVWDGENVDTTILLGVSSENGRGNIVAYGGYRTTAAVPETQRDYTACPLQAAANFGIASNGFVCGGSPNSAVGFLFSLDGFVGPFRSTKSGDLVPFEEPQDYFNYAPFNYLQRPDTRWTAGWFGHYDLGKSAVVYASTMFMDDHTVVQIAPSGWFAGGGAFGGAMAVNCNNPFLGSASNPSSPESILCVDQGLGPQDDSHLLIGRRLVESGDRQQELDHTSYRFITGLKGELTKGWSYDIFAQYGKTLYGQVLLNDASVAREQNALEVVLVNGVPTCKAAVSGSDPACVPANIFQLGQLSPAAVKYLAAGGLQEGSTVEEVVSGSVIGDLGRLGMRSPLAHNAVSVALGIEYREEKLQNEVDEEFSSGDLAGYGAATPSVKGRFDVAEEFDELRVPLIEDSSFAELLQLEAGYRYSSYSTAGPLTTYKIGAEWQPIDDIRFRSTYQRAARAPNILELFTPQSAGGWFLGNNGDPCGTDETLTQAQCDRTNGGKHLGGYGTQLLNCPSSCSDILGGSTDLRPEVALTRSVGVVLTPEILQGFSATIDYFDIKIANVIGVFPQAVVVQACAVGGSQYFCEMIHRAPGTGILYGTAGYIDSLNRNTGLLQSKGIDFQANYTTDLSNWGAGTYGTLSFDFLGTWTRRYFIEPVPADALKQAGIPPPYSGDCAGLFGMVCGYPLPRWRHKARVTWASPWDVTFSVQWRHSSAVKLDGNTNNPILNSACGRPCGDTAEARIGSYDYFDLTLAWSLNSNAEVRAGINNVFDRDPPLISSNIIAAPLGYDLLGRTIFVGYTVKM
jgi:outer membrane receptor protein involved in Fe transport